eukprot:GHVN01070870.1.p1 GENE.GHVN01070870.1~~GHVN01070870.1.p1  ORF type:complete len:341 (+),score=43.26 GHVN01070870.1:280-1302(+)
MIGRSAYANLLRRFSELNKKEITEAVTVIDTPPVVVVGVVGYTETITGIKTLATVWAEHLSDDFKRRYYKRWYKSKKKAFTRHQATVAESKGKGEDVRDAALNRIKEKCTVVRAICHTQRRIAGSGKYPKAKKAHVYETQINGGSIPDKVDFVVKHFEQPLAIKSLFEENQMIDVIGVTKGKGVKGVVTRWGVTRLPRKTHRGLRKVACIGAWHPAQVQYQVPRHGQCGFHHRTEQNKKIYRIGNGKDERSGSTEADISAKCITPMGGWPHYGVTLNDFVMIKGCCVGVKRRPLTLRLTMHARTAASATETTLLKFIDTSSKMGHGRFQTSDEKNKFYGL